MNRPKIIYIIAMLIFGSIGLFVRGINLSSGQIALARGFVGSLCLLIACPILKQKLSWTAIRPNLVKLILSGVAIGFNWIFLFEAYQYTSIATATICYYFSPVFVIILTPFILKERTNMIRLLSIFIAVGGMFFIVGNGLGGGKNDLIGIVFGLMAATLYASVVITNKFLKGLSGLETTVIQISSATIILFPYILLTEKLQFHFLDRSSWIILVVVGVIHTGLAYLLYFTALRKLSAQTAAAFSYVDPISAILFSAILLQEPLTLYQILGGILVLGSTFLSEMSEQMKAKFKVPKNKSRG